MCQAPVRPLDAEGVTVAPDIDLKRRRRRPGRESGLKTERLGRYPLSGIKRDERNISQLLGNVEGRRNVPQVRPPQVTSCQYCCQFRGQRPFRQNPFDARDETCPEADSLTGECRP